MKAKKQHYVPQFYLRQFADNDKKIYFLNVNTLEYSGKKVPCGSQCHKTYYYGHDEVWEKKLGKLETNWGLIFNKFRNNPKYIPDDKELRELKRFAFYQQLRGIANNEHILQSKKEMLEITAKIKFEHEKFDFDENVLHRAVSEVVSSDDLAKSVLDELSSLEPLLQDLQPLIVNYLSRKVLIISDNPVVMINRFHEQSIGLLSMGLVVFFPLSPTRLIVFYDKKVYPNYADKLEIVISNDTEVMNVNAFQFVNADSLIFSKEEINPKDFFAIVESRKKNRSANAMSKLGGHGQYLLASTYRMSIFKCNLSFAQIPLCLSKIPYVCREGAPRIFDQGWQDKLHQKASYLPAILRLSKVTTGFTSREIRHGCTDMCKFAKKYWSEK